MPFSKRFSPFLVEVHFLRWSLIAVEHNVGFGVSSSHIERTSMNGDLVFTY